ncbi:MAG: pyridoxal phosphate-dependent aminotransferase [Flavobacteriales bacterium]|nr:pyridoxal phosphate-dependent aminotransferase [Flavobacteriales bacterium]
MPRISTKGQAMPDSPIRKLAPYAVAAKAAGRKVLHLNIGQPDIETPSVALEAVRNMERTVIEYSPSDGFASYREGLADYYDSVGVKVSPDQILVTTGGSEALIFAFQACFEPGDEVIIPEPFYANYLGFAMSAGVKVVPVTSRIEDGFALPPVAEIAAKVTDRTKAILICNPGNPTGYVYTDAELEAIRSLVLEHDLYLFADEVYREFCYGDIPPRSVLSLDGLDDHVVLMDSVSKRYSMCGARVGALVTRNAALRQACMRFAMARLSPPTLGQIAGEAALKTPRSYFDKVKASYVGRRDALIEGLRAIPGVTAPTPGGAFYAVAKLPIDSSDAFCQWILSDFDLDGDTVMMAPASGFYATPGAGTDEVRIAYVLEESAIRRAVAVIAAALKVYPGRS